MSENKEVDNNIEVDTSVAEAVSDAGDMTNELQAEIEKLKQELVAAQAKAQENYDLALRAKADADNTVRRMEKDVTNAHKFALEKFAQDLMPVVDSMDLGLSAVIDENATVEKFREGTELTFKMLLSALEKHGVQVINPQGSKFDPEFHQAMSMQENPSVEPNTVIGVMQKGYTLHGRLLRPAMVVVSKGGTAKPTASQIDETV